MNEDESVQQGQTDAGSLDSSIPLNQDGVGRQDTAGALLREARQSQGLDIATLAGLLKVPVQKLQALEQDQFELLLDPVFARALASSICRMLKLDPAPVLQRLPAIAAFKVTSQNRGINTPFRARSGGHGASVWSQISRPAILVGLAFLLGALVLIFLPDIQQEISRFKQDGLGSANQNELVEPVSITTPVTTQIVPGTVASDAASNPTVQSLPPAEVQAFVSTPTSSVALRTVEADALVTFSATGETWVKVTDAKGVVALNRTLRAGELAGASGSLPLLAVVGRADVIQVQIRGQAFGLSGVTKNNIARFEVK